MGMISRLIGTPPIHPVLFYSGKILGYLIWGIFLLSALDCINFPGVSLPVLRYIAYGLTFFGLLIVIISLINLGNSTRFGLPTNSTSFKTKGLYRLSRNPMYLGLHLFTLASIIYLANIFILIIGIYSLLVYHFIILAEEKFLEARFGRDYVEYKKKVRRYI